VIRKVRHAPVAAPRKKREFLRIVRETFLLSVAARHGQDKMGRINRILRGAQLTHKLTVPFGCHRGRSAASRAGCRNRALRWCLANNRIAAERCGTDRRRQVSARHAPEGSRCPGSSKVKQHRLRPLSLPRSASDLSRDNPYPASGGRSSGARRYTRSATPAKPEIGRFVSNL